MNNYPPFRSGEKWVEYEDNGLLYELQNGKKIGEIAYKHHRTIGAITSRIKKIAENMIKNNENIDNIVNTTKLSKEEIQKIINKKENKKMMSNGSWNKKKISNKAQHIQNMKDKLFMMKNGYWIKTQDKKEDLDREYELKKFKQLQRGHPSQFKYVSKSKYPDMILQKIDEPPHFNYDNILINKLGGNQLSIHDTLYGNYILYTYIKYIIDYNPNSKHNTGISSEQLYKYDLVDKQLEIEIKSLESMIYLFENM